MRDLRSALLTLLDPIERIAQTPQQIYNNLTTDFTSFDEIKQENERLKTELLLLKAKQQQLIKMEQEVSRLRALLGTTGRVNNATFQIATVNFFSSNPLSQFITINKGAMDDVKPQQTVIDALGIIGQVVNTTPHSSRVLLITDPAHQLPVRIQRTGQRGILSGSGHDNTQLNFIPKSSEILVGDLLETSGLGGIFPSGYPVAIVSKVISRASDPYYEIFATPLGQLNQARQVLILKQQRTPFAKINTDLDTELSPNSATDSTLDSINSGQIDSKPAGQN
ncbi:hypothetical protein THMIRHAS_07650 [Thiosulfatimonas sediminis]|uniref:Cell shape-determining protein MreC n=2 Tax=Thiosulfatimonas sediminis TaxID=2675054 RepID=A0A6F8PTC4_9GAMM|nr:hypothetical protein THMIRHAS_07650 [Thiosulfatimonas sediminis]